MEKLLFLLDQYKTLGISGVIDHEKFNLISIVHHSTKIEGCTLTEIETQVLLDEGLTPKGKPLHDSLMVTDNFAALQFVLNQARSKSLISVEFIQAINSYVAKHTGSVFNTIFGSIDARTGAFRKGNVIAGVSYFPNFDEVETLTRKMVIDINDQLKKPSSLTEQLYLSFDAHFNLVSIHPFYDGNGRTSRLLMNYIQAYYNLPMALVPAESKVEYIEALVNARKEGKIEIFREFMRDVYAQHLQNEIEKFEQIG